MFFRSRRLPAAIALALLSAPGFALSNATDSADDAAIELDQITVTATKTPRTVEDTPGTVTVKDRERLDREIVTDIRDLVRYEPGVTVGNNPTRFGLSGFTIRGIDGNRVLIEIDGVRVPDAFAIGSFSNAGRDLVDVDLLKQVEIIRGAASSLYGSSAIGGVVSFQSKDPEDYLEGGGSSHLGLKGGWYGADDGRYGGLTAAVGGDKVSFLLGISHREGHETENRGSVDVEDPTRTRPNPQDYSVDSALAKAVFKPADGHRLELAFETGRGDTQTEVLTGRATTINRNPAGTIVSTVNVRDLTGDDQRKRTRYGAEYTLEADAAFVDEVRLQAYHQRSDTTQNTFEFRQTTPAATGTVTPQERYRQFTFDQEATGAELLLRKDVAWGASDHRLIVGGEHIDTNISQLRNGFARHPVTGAINTTIPPDAFPVRDFPNSGIQESALFVQDEVEFAEGSVVLIPGLRYDRYRLTPHPDDIFRADNPGIVPTPLAFNRASPKLGALWWFTPNWAVTGQYAEGFRAPPYNDVNLGFTNLQFGYTAIPNPDLKPETSRSLELGLRGAFDWGRLSLTGFHNRYDEFIESLTVLPASHPMAVPGLTTFQSRNLKQVTIRGLELSGVLDFAAFSDALSGFSLRTAAAYARGDDDSANEPLLSVDPARLVVGLAYDHGDGRWGGEFISTAVHRQDRLPERSPALRPAPGYVVFDLLGYWRPLPGLTVNAGLFNLADRRYVEWSDLRLAGLTTTSPVLDRYTRPGRHLGLNVRYHF